MRFPPLPEDDLRLPDLQAWAPEALGGAERLAEWAADSPENEAAFWRSIYPRLLPSSVNVLALQKLQQRSVLPRGKEQIVERLVE